MEVRLRPSRVLCHPRITSTIPALKIQRLRIISKAAVPRASSLCRGRLPRVAWCTGAAGTLPIGTKGAVRVTGGVAGGGVGVKCASLLRTGCVWFWCGGGLFLAFRPSAAFFLLWRIDRDMASLTHALRRDVIRVGVVRIREILIMNPMVENPIALPVQAADPRWLFVSISLHVYIVIVLIPPRFPSFFLPTLIPPLPSFLAHVRFTSDRDHASTAQPRRLSGSAQSCAIRTFPSQNGGFVVVPIAFAEVEAAVFGPEEEPDADEDESDAEKGEEGEKGAVVDVRGFDGAGAGVVGWVLRWFFGLSRLKTGGCFERGQGESAGVKGG